MKSFTIDKVAWHTRTPGNTESIESITQRFRSVISFFQNNALTIRTILPEGESVTDDTAIKSDDLTEEGLALMKAVYQQWLEKVDEGLDPKDLSLFTSKLARLRGKK